MKKVLFFFLVASSFGIRAQPSYIAYHNQIIEAESLFLSGDFNRSLEKYRAIFTSYPKPFAKDCFIALEIAALRNDTATSRYFFEQCFNNGVNWSVLKTVPKIRELLNNNREYEYSIQRLYNATRTRYLKSLDSGILKQVMRLVKRDSKYKNPGNNNIADWQNLYASVLDSNLDDLVKIVEKHGYPGEHMIGIWDHEIDNVSPDLTLLLSSIPSVMFFHHECGVPMLKDKLWVAVVKGELHPREYALMYEWAIKGIRDRRFVKSYNGKNAQYLKSYNILPYRIKCTDDSLTKCYNIYLNDKYYSRDVIFVNDCREEIGMSTLEHDKRKRKFEQEYDVKLFFGLFKRY